MRTRALVTPGRLLLLAACVVAAGGCASRGKPADERCQANQEYQRSGSIEGLVIPGDLSPAERNRTLVIPPVAAEADAAAAGRCLDFPPDYFGRDIRAPVPPAD